MHFYGRGAAVAIFAVHFYGRGAAEAIFAVHFYGHIMYIQAWI